ncbi:hypothetical protein BD414DRAFT_487653 [Trametes punicea]|nr:hypothetical protein BD414DRAFT_487653 [Trametes punicea]
MRCARSSGACLTIHLVLSRGSQRYDAEVAASAKIARAIANVVTRSPHARFWKQSHRFLKVCHVFVLCVPRLNEASSVFLFSRRFTRAVLHLSLRQSALCVPFFQTPRAARHVPSTLLVSRPHLRIASMSFSLRNPSRSESATEVILLLKLFSMPRPFKTFDAFRVCFRSRVQTDVLKPIWTKTTSSLCSRAVVPTRLLMRSP